MLYSDVYSKVIEGFLRSPFDLYCDGLHCLVFTRCVFSPWPSSVLIVRFLPQSKPRRRLEIKPQSHLPDARWRCFQHMSERWTANVPVH
jgi:hypothetical protein